MDWVKARSMCTAKMLFGKLQKVVEKDVESGKTNVYDRFFLRPGVHDDTFAVDLHGEDGQFVRRRVFELVDQKIRVYEKSTDSDVFLTGRASLTDTQDCLIEVEGKPPMELWQFSCLALENFFFSGR